VEVVWMREDRFEDGTWERGIASEEDVAGLKMAEVRYLNYIRQSEKEIDDYYRMYPEELE
jgi:hypothetical protein